MRYASKKRAPQLREYTKRRKDFLLQNPFCRVCKVRASEIHHSKGRIGALLNAEEHWIQLCHNCHAKAHYDRRWACHHGLLPKPAWLMAEELKNEC